MANELSKAIKQKTDSQLRLLDQDTAPVIRQSTTGENYAVDPNEYSQSLTAGKNITINTAGNIKTINAVMGILAGDNITVSEPDENGNVTITGTLNGTPVNIADFTGKDGFVLTYDGAGNEFILTEVAGGAIEQATETVLGGIKAKAKTTESAEVAIDTSTGKLYTTENDFTVFSADGMITEDFEDDTLIENMNIEGLSNYSAGYLSPRCLYFKTASTGTYDKIINIFLVKESNISFWYKNDVYYNNDSWNRFYILIDDIQVVYKNADTPWTLFSKILGSGWHKITLRAYSYYNPVYSCAWWFDNLTIPSSGIKGMQAVATNPNSLLLTAIDGSHVGFLPKINLMQKLQDGTLPTPTAELRGQIFTLEGGAGVADISYICKKDATDVYIWVEI